MPAASAGCRWLRSIWEVEDTPSRRRILWIHAGLAIATVLCVSAFVVEVLRATGGNTLSWAYVFEWPLLLAYAVYMWHRLINEERGVTVEPAAASEKETADREAWNAHLAALHAADAAARVERQGS